MYTHPVFSITETPCGRPVYEADMTDWAAEGFPHPTQPGVTYPGGVELHVVREDDPANKYGVMYFVGELDGAFVRFLND